MLATMEVEQEEQEEEVMGHPGHVRDMIARFTQMAPLNSSSVLPSVEDKSEIRRNGIYHDVPPGNDVMDNAVEDDERSPGKPIIRDITLGKTINNNIEKLWNNELRGDGKETSNEFLFDYRKVLKPVAKHFISDTNHVSDVIIVNDTPSNDVVEPAVITNGSEPSLVSRNSQRSGTTASKRTLVSQDTTSPHKSHPQSATEVSPPRSSSQPTLLDDTMPATTDSSFDSSIDTTPKTPSYMKISCALSGYNRYYTSPKQEAKLKVIKLSEQNGSHSSLSSSQSDSSEVRSNGDLKPNNKVKDEVEEVGRVSSNKNGVAVILATSRNSEQEQLVINGSSRIIQNGADTNQDSQQQQHQQRQQQQQQTVVVNGGTDKLSESENGEGHRYVTMATVNLRPSCSPPTTPEVRNLQWEEKRRPDLKSAVSTPSPSKDGHYYFPILDREVARIQALCAHCTQYLEGNSLPEEVSGKIRTSIGKSNLLVNKKFQQFRGLCERNINQSSDEPFTTTVADLAGFWDMVSLQISDIDTMFRDIENMRRSDWKIIKDKSPIKQTASKSAKITRSKDASSTPSKSAKSAKAEEAARARDEARKRLLAAKRAGRQRKASQSDKEEIEIFVAE